MQEQPTPDEEKNLAEFLQIQNRFVNGLKEELTNDKLLPQSLL